MRAPRIAIIGAGMAGLAAAIDLARQGADVTVFERAATPGGKLRQVRIEDQLLDAGPTVFTLRGVFERLFADAGDALERRLQLTPAGILARHAWRDGSQLDLYADEPRTVAAIAAFSGARDAQGFIDFSARAKQIYATLDPSFMNAPRPSLLGLVRRVGMRRRNGLWNIQPFTTLWRAADRYFKDPRLRQLFARYATYCGSSPFASPATLMLIAHVEQAGVWYVQGGMYQLAAQLAALAERQGARLQYDSEIVSIHTRHGRISEVQTHRQERLPVDAVICNADTNALASGMFGESVRGGVRATAPASRSLSAVTWNLLARTEGFELAHHTVFFSDNYRAEFDDIFRRHRLPRAPTVYLCAQDRCDASVKTLGNERLLCLINAPPVGDRYEFDTAEMDACENRLFRSLEDFGLKVHRHGRATATSPSDFNRLFPATGGALYGPASHGWMASFKRAGSRTAIPGLYLAGGSSHPGPGLPMAATSGRLAAACIMADHASILRSHPVAMPGGTSMA